VSRPSSPIRVLVRRQRRRQSANLALAAASAAGAAAAAVALLGLSGWFLTGAAVAGAAGPLAVSAFNYLLPSAAIRFLAMARTGLRYTERLTGHAAAFQALADIRPELFAGLARAPIERALGLSSGEATGRLVQDVDAIETLFVRLSAPWAALASTLAAVTLIALASRLAALAFLAAWVLQAAIGVWIGRVRSWVPAGEALREAGALKDRLQAYAAASAELHCFGMTDQVLGELMRQDGRLADAHRRSWAALARLGMLQPGLSALAAGGVLALCGQAPPALAALAALAALLGMEGANGLLAAIDRFGAVDTAAGRLDEMLASRPALAVNDVEGRPDIRVRRRTRTLDLPAGDRVALVGPSGVGKTRILDALVGLRTTRWGELAIAGRRAETIDAQVLRRLFAYAPQNAAMISGTVRDNLRLGDPHASEARLYDALSTAQLADKVVAMPDGLDAWIGEGGARLSGGERRRLSVARALLRPAPWLLLDEPTEGLDPATEARLVQALEVHLAASGQGLILVSHRPAPRILCRRILTLTADIVERGPAVETRGTRLFRGKITSTGRRS
jgi:ATP-binding cassette subfamily C protein CydC